MRITAKTKIDPLLREYPFHRGADLEPLRKRFADLIKDVDAKEISKMEQTLIELFPLLEAKGVSGPSQVMWAIHDDIRAHLKQKGRGQAQKEARMQGLRLPRRH